MTATPRRFRIGQIVARGALVAGCVGVGAASPGCYGGQPAQPTFASEPPGPTGDDANTGEASTASCPNDSPAACPSPAPSWAMQVQPYVEQLCALGGQCHGAGGQSVLDFTTYAGVKKNFVTMESDLLSCKMPPPGALAPTLEERTTLLGWFLCGAPDN